MMSLKFLKGLNIENNVLKLYQFNKVVCRIISSWIEFKVTKDFIMIIMLYS